MNKVVIALFAVVAVTAAQSNDAQAEVLRFDSTVNTDSFQYAYETSNGIAAQEQGQLKQLGADSAIVTQGSYSWTSPEGEQFQVNFVADEHGYQPEADHLPVGPPVPDLIQRALQYIANNPSPQNQQQF